MIGDPRLKSFKPTRRAHNSLGLESLRTVLQNYCVYESSVIALSWYEVIAVFIQFL